MEGGIGSPQPETETLPSEGSGANCLPIGTPASACPRRHLLTGWPWRLVEASCTLRAHPESEPGRLTGVTRPLSGQNPQGPRSAPALVPSLPWPARRLANLFHSAGGIRTHGLELMRLARTAAPLPRKVWPAGVEPAISGARSRRGGHTPPQPVDDRRVPPAGLEPAASGLRARRHRLFDHGGKRVSRQLRRQDSNLRQLD